MSLLQPNWRQLPGSKISTDWENALKNGSFTTYFVHQNQGGLCEIIGDRLGRQGKAKWGNPWDGL